MIMLDSARRGLRVPAVALVGTYELLMMIIRRAQSLDAAAGVPRPGPGGSAATRRRGNDLRSPSPRPPGCSPIRPGQAAPLGRVSLVLPADPAHPRRTQDPPGQTTNGCCVLGRGGRR